FVLIAAIMAWVFRSWRMTVIALIPNIVPLVVVGGIMGLLGIDIKVSTAIIFTIAFGIAVDDTIHMLGKLRIELMKGRSLAYATKRAFLSTGKALVITTIMLLSGFVSLVFSGFASVYYMGLLVSITLAVALVADVLLLPLLVLWGLPPRKHQG
ncbi:MAG: MMPL family transporter, partial [Flavobacteriales bacterium]